MKEEEVKGEKKKKPKKKKKEGPSFLYVNDINVGVCEAPIVDEGHDLEFGGRNIRPQESC
ncbi:uncharacterized protein A4U43_C10F19520 [Asparagus officinalis]|uniref:Uncharacterized protein n=1 Tax=Asparagus officinalis TaxID=4686 RepID=A0A5P1E5X6_ASPOF|nr:uncharacterized protein A4U43_C10F19520 [Asparagus officinalis]